MRSKAKILQILRNTVLIVLVLTMALGLFACNDSGKSNSDNNNDTTPPTTDNGNTENPNEDDNKPNEDNNQNEEDNKPAEPTVVDFDGLVEKLGSSPFRDFIKTKGKFGISDATLIGVNKDRFENEILYAFPADSEFVEIIKLADHGFGANKSDTENSSIIDQALQSLKSAEGKKKLVFPEGTFKLARAITIKEFNDLYVEGNNTKLVYTSWTQAYVIQESENIHTSNITYTFEVSSMITGKVTEYNAATKTVTLTIDEKQKLDDYTSKSTVFGYYDLEWSEADNRYYINTKGNTRYYVSDTFSIKNIGTRTVTVKFSSEPDVVPTKDTLVSITLESYNSGKCSLSTTTSKNIYFENIGVNSNPGMAFVATSSENIYVNRLTIYPDMERNLYTSTSSDGIHTIDIRGDFILTNSIVDGTQDDCLNVCATYDMVSGAGAKKITLQKNASDIRVGDTIEVYDPSTMKLYGAYTVKEINGTTLTLNKMVDEGIKSGFWVGNVSGATHLTIDNCIFGNTYSRGGLIQCRDSKIINSTYYNMTLSPLVIHSTNDQYREAIMPKNITIENCKFYSCNEKQLYYASIQIITHNGKGGTTPGTLTDININNCFFGETGGSAVLFYGAGNSSFTNNLLYNLNRVKRTDWSKGMCDCAIGIRSSNNITVKNNYAYITDSTRTFEMIAGEGNTGLTEEKNILKATK